jgi:hypothetical protein
MDPGAVSDAGRDEIASAIARGRARVAAVTSDPDEIARLVKDAGLNEWRREALAWTAAHDRERLESQFSLLELLWLGSPRNTDAVALDAWGAAMLRVTGCLCLEMPRPGTGDQLEGRPVAGLPVSRGAEVGLRVAEVLAELEMPAALAPGVIAFAMQHVLDSARLAYRGDWSELSRAARALDSSLVGDYIAALAAGGPLLSAPARNDQRP